MRKIEEIKNALDKYPYMMIDKVKIELLLDIRQLLVSLCKTLFVTDFEGEYQIHPMIDCSVIPDPEKLIKMKKKLDKLLEKK